MMEKVKNAEVKKLTEEVLLTEDKPSEEKPSEEKPSEEIKYTRKVTGSYYEGTQNKTVYKKEDMILALILISGAWIYINGLRYFNDSRLSVFTLWFLAAGICYLNMTGQKMTREGEFYLILTAISGAWFLVSFLPGCSNWQDQEITFYLALFLHVMGVYWVLTISKNRIDGCLNENGLRDIVRGLFILPFANFIRIVSVLIGGFTTCIRRLKVHKKEKSTVALQILIGIGVSIPVLILVLPALAAADENFRVFTGDFALWCVEMWLSFCSIFSFSEILVNFVLLAIGCYLFGLFYGAFHTQPPKPWEKTELPVAILLTFSTVICGVYLLFFAVKFVGTFTVLFSQNPDVVYSDFARQGFFELCFIAAINFCLFYGVKSFASGENKWVKAALTLLGTETLLFILLAFSKMSLYISVYGFTFKRVFTSWFMGVLFFTFILLIRNVWKKCEAIRSAVIFGAVTFLLLAYSNVDFWIIRLNVLMQVG